MSFVTDYIDLLNDMRRRLSRLERLDVNPPAAFAVTYSGTPIAGQVAYWPGPGTIAGAGSVLFGSPATLYVQGTATNANETLKVTRNLSSGSTNAPVVYILQDHASDDQVALLIKQDGSVSALQLQTTAAGPLLDFFGGYSITEGGNTFNTGFFRGSSDDAIAFTMVRSSASNALIGAGVNGDTVRRFIIQADGEIIWGDGSSSRDTTLYRSAAGALTTDGKLGVGQTSPSAQLDVVGTATSSETARITRNLASGSTDSPVVYILNDHASDDQPALRVRNDGGGNTLEVQIGATNYFVIDEAGNVGIGPSIDPEVQFKIAGSVAGLRLLRDSGNAFVDMGQADSPSTNFGVRLRTLQDLNALAIGRYASTTIVYLYIDANGIRIGDGTAPSHRIEGLAGTSTNDFAAGGVLYETRTQTGNVGSGEDDLASYSVPADTLSANGMGLRLKAWGRFANNGNLKRVRARFGTSGTNLLLASDNASFTNQLWQLEVEIVRTGAATQRSAAKILVGTNSGATTATVYMEHNNSLNQTLSGAVTLKVTGEATSNDDVIIDEFRVEWLDNNT